MIPWLRVALVGVVGVLVFDTTAAVVSRATGFEYSYGAIGSWLLTAVAGYFAARGRTVDRIQAAAAHGRCRPTSS